MKRLIGLITSLAIFTANIGIVFAEEVKVDISSKSAILMDVSSGKVIFEKNSNEKLPPASVTKVMTMLLIVEALESGKIKIDDEVQISENASSMGGSQIFLEPGETQKVDDLLKGIAVASANDACVAMAEYIGGSVEEFVVLMNNKAKELGMVNTNFVNTNGLPVENHYTTAYDIALMSKELLSHEIISKYLTTWMDNVVVGKNKNTVGLANTNKLVKYYNGTTGVKTGFTNEAKFCVSASAKRDNTHLVCVILGGETSQERFKDATTLLNYGFANYDTQKIIQKDTKVTTVQVDKAKEEIVDVVCKDDLDILLKKGEDKEFTKKIELSKDIKLPVKKGDTIGKLQVYQKDKLIGEIDLISNKDINRANYFEMLEKVVYSLM